MGLRTGHGAGKEVRVTTTVEGATTTPVVDRGARGGPDQPDPAQGRLVGRAGGDGRGSCTAFVIYSTWAAFVGKDYYAGADLHRDLISPFYSPCIANSCVPGSHSFGTLPFWNYSPALLILIFPLGFRLTCYYYRKAYYRSFWCPRRPAAWPTPTASYSGETRFPLILQNIHRYFFWLLLHLQLHPHLRRHPGLPPAPRGLQASASASGRWCSAPTPPSCGSTACRATPAGTSAAAR